MMAGQAQQEAQIGALAQPSRPTPLPYMHWSSEQGATP